MTIQIELDRGSEEILAAQAHSKGVSIERYAGDILQQALASQPSGTMRRATKEELKEFLDGMVGDWAGIPLRPGETFDRESIYGDHD